MIWPTYLISLLALPAFLHSSEATELEVYAPRITNPTAYTVWKIGEYYDVTWDTGDAPKAITNPTAEIYLVHRGITLLDHPIATDVNILAGYAVIQVPSVKPGKYRVNLYGDSGDRSALFAIEW